MPTNVLYDTYFKRLQQLWPAERVTRLRNLAWMMAGIFMSESVYLSKIAVKIRSGAVQLSIVKRLRRFLDNGAFDVRTWYEPVARQVLESIGGSVAETRLLMDATTIGSQHQWLTVSIAFRRRAIPIAWTWLPSAKGHSSAEVQLALLRYVHSLLPPGMPVLLVGDTEFEDGDVQKQLNAWEWRYVLRQKPNNVIYQAGEWRPFGALVSRPGASVWTENALLTMKHKLAANLLAYWQVGEDKPWLLATNLPSVTATLRAYRRRMWIEEMHGDLKDHGFDMEASRLRSAARLSRLAFAVTLLYLWTLMYGVKAIKNGDRRLVDRNDRRDLSIFQIGLRWIERRLTAQQPIPLPALSSPNLKLSGS